MGQVDDFLVLCGNWEGPEIDEALNEASNQLLPRLKNDAALRTRLLQSIAKLPPHGAAWIALIFGVLVEQGLDAGEALPAVERHLRKVLERLPVLDPDQEDVHLDDEQQLLAEANDMLCQALVALLAAAPDHHQRLAADGDLCAALDMAAEYSNGPVWLASLLRRRSGELVVLHPPTRKAYRLAYRHVECCFHLFSLIQATLGSRLPGGRKPAKALAAAARGAYHTEALHDEAWWHYGDPAVPEPGLIGMVPGEASVDALRTIDGTRLLLLFPPLLGSRTWDSGFFGPSLMAAPPSMTIQAELAPAEVDTWMDRLNLT